MIRFTRTAPIDALMAGVYDGDYAVGDLKQHGDIGVGTLNALDGELVDPSDSIYLALPRQGDFTSADLSADRQQDLQREESSPK